MGMSEVTLEVQLTETSLTSFITFWILVQISWKISVDFHVLFPFIIPLLGVIGNVFFSR
jgi:hypothetical protein